MPDYGTNEETTMRYGKRFARRPLEVETLFLVTTIVFALAAIGLLIGKLWIS